MPVFERIAILGLGLLGGSVALAAKRRGAAARVVGAARRPEVLEQALHRDAVDETAEFADAVREADLVVLATPVFSMADLVRRVAPGLRDGAIVTDVGSVKGLLAETLPGLLGPGVAYRGSHPMAGSHAGGLEHARADLFEGAPCILTGDGEPAERLAEFWTALGATVVRRDPNEHDREVAWVSHVPHVVAFAYAHALAAAPAGVREVLGSGFHDFTRIAHSDPALWGEILLANRKAIGPPLQRVSETLAGLARAIESNDAEALENAIASARESLSLVASAKHDGGKPQPGTAAPNEDGRERSAK